MGRHCKQQKCNGVLLDMTRGHLSNGRIVIQDFKKFQKISILLRVIVRTTTRARSKYKLSNFSHAVIESVSADVRSKLAIISNDEISG